MRFEPSIPPLLHARKAVYGRLANDDIDCPISSRDDEVARRATRKIESLAPANAPLWAAFDLGSIMSVVVQQLEKLVGGNLVPPVLHAALSALETGINGLDAIQAS